MKSISPDDVLQNIHKHAVVAVAARQSLIDDLAIRERVEYVCHCMSNRSGVRLVMACLLAKLDKPHVDPRKSYTEIGGKNCFSGRRYDEQYLTKFIHTHQLPINTTPAFLTPTLRNINQPLTTNRALVGRPRELYSKVLQLLEDVALGRITANVVLTEIIRLLLNLRDEKAARMESLLQDIRRNKGNLPLSSEAIVTLIRQHLACRHASHLPVLIVTAAYQAAGKQLGEQLRPLHTHNTADLQTGALRDIELCLADEDKTVTVYEMKMKQITRDDIDQATQ